MSARADIRTNVRALTEALNAETDALVAGAALPPPAAKLALLATVERAGVTAGEMANTERSDNGAEMGEALAALATAARRNRAALAARRDAARDLLDDLNARLAEAEADGTYTRGELLGLMRPRPPAALPPPSLTPLPDAGA